MPKTRYATVDLEGFEVFYRQAGDIDNSTILLLHGFPSASHMFRDLIPLLAKRYHVVAPDLPGFGQSGMPPAPDFPYSFKAAADLMTKFVEALGLGRFAMYLFDYGAPIGLRMALQHPERVQAIISQNGNAYEEGLGPGWESMKEFWRDPTTEYRESLRAAFIPSATSYQYEVGVLDRGLVAPDGQNLDNYYLARPGAHEPQLAYFLDYASNVALYPQFQSYLRERQPPVLAIWGEYDPYFIPAGASEFKRDVPDAEVTLLPTGHFALETHASEIAELITNFLGRKLAGTRPGRAD
ncbi:pimeloyl-ACP methyl ester carboxylesterase [Phyllobacterium trifolii]|uniref:Pimeloyl-ACP methyl ester carboxylesterase n=1 Tax=Phyllobacterium trifolii TaxID=300193 RepID=A0A839UI23_9HYPH|nr:alpha/beta hydrolase [Phyllobacterium trifolii]MBB3148520.1 pimeloyl-ACP methyl ester carboxylesterase [Phyllobacterium trifolii]